MKLRKNKKLVPDKSVYVEAELKGKKHHFKIPSPLIASKILRSIDQDLLVKLSALSEEKNPQEVIKQMPELIAFFSAVIGKSWINEEHELEVDEKIKDIMEYGEKVYEELYEEEYTLMELFAIGGKLIKLMFEKLNKHQEVAERADFLSPKE